MYLTVNWELLIKNGDILMLFCKIRPLNFIIEPVPLFFYQVTILFIIYISILPHYIFYLSNWLNIGDTLPARLEQWFLADLPVAALETSLLDLLQVPGDEFWSWHWTLRSKRTAKPQPLLGATRATDLAVNVVLPWLWVRARDGKNAALQTRAEQRFLAWPAAEDNAVLRLARQRLLGGTRLPTPTAATQQGLLQIVRDFCQHSNALCAGCRFPELVHHWKLVAP